MCTIIQFPTIHSAAYDNLVQLFDICDNVDSCNFYLESVETLAESGSISEKEMYTLRRIGRTKRIELAHPQQTAVVASAPGVYAYAPEMGQHKPEGCQIEASLSHYGKHYFIDTPLQLKGRGITLIRTYSARDFVDPNNRKVGWNEYSVTRLAFEKLQSQYAISYESNLD